MLTGKVRIRVISDTKYQLRQTCSNNSSIVTTIVTRLKRAKSFGSNNKIFFVQWGPTVCICAEAPKIRGKDRSSSAEKNVPGVTDLVTLCVTSTVIIWPFAQTLHCFLELTAISLVTGSRDFSPSFLSGEPLLTFPKTNPTSPPWVPQDLWKVV